MQNPVVGTQRLVSDANRPLADVLRAQAAIKNIAIRFKADSGMHLPGQAAIGAAHDAHD
jgi:hypothetical protein